MSYEISGKVVGKEWGFKRCHLPGLIESIKCPECGVKTVEEFDGDRFNYPDVGIPMEHNLYCSTGCQHEWSVKVQLDVSLTVVGSEQVDEFDRGKKYMAAKVESALQNIGVHLREGGEHT